MLSTTMPTSIGEMKTKPKMAIEFVEKKPSRESPKREAEIIKEQIAFLLKIWKRRNSFCFLSTKCCATGQWVDHPINLRFGFHDAIRVLKNHSRWKFDIYFSPNQFSAPKRVKANALNTCWGWCDIDDADPTKFEPKFSCLWRTSPGRHQALWRWNKYEPTEMAEAYSRALAYRFGADRNGWTVTKVLRLPFTINHKRNYNLPKVQLLYCDGQSISERPLLLQSRILKKKIHSGHSMRISWDQHKLNDVINKFRRKLHPRAIVLMRNKRVYENNRSKCIFEIVAGLHQAGASRDQIASCLWDNPYFLEKHGKNATRLVAEISRITTKLECER